MKKKDLTQLRTQSQSELEKRVRELRAEVVRLTPRLAAGAEKNLKQKKFIRREIAQILGIIREQHKKEVNK